MNDQELIHRIRLGEDGGLELKEVRFQGKRIAGPRRDDLADDLAAFANSRGGVVVLGVRDSSREVVGIPVERLDAIETLVREICTDSITPSLDAGIYRRELCVEPEPAASTTELKPVLLVEVPRSLDLHRSPRGWFRRVGSSTRAIPPAELQRLMIVRASTGLMTFDESPVPRTTVADLDTELAERFLGEEHDFQAARRKLRLIVEDGDGNPRLSVAAVAMCTSEPQQWLRAAYIQAVMYAGDRLDTEYQLDARDIVGPLDAQVAGGLDFIRHNMRLGAVKAVGREDVPQYSERAVFEALVNAVAHRDYSMTGSRVRLHMFSDRIELAVPGALANTLTPDALHLRQVSRNPLIVSLLARCPSPPGLGKQRLMEQRGDGVPRIRADTKELTGRYPEYSLVDDSELRLVLPAAVPF
ncbi:MAG: putative DNA binding domain-containing protein [Acidobacteria bacterium]|nr:putative DNA binding domain-containing protein [Acidobacteriota bacterium]